MSEPVLPKHARVVVIGGGFVAFDAARTALRVQQIVAHETDVASTADPLAGSWFVESLTDDLEASIRGVM